MDCSKENPGLKLDVEVRQEDGCYGFSSDQEESSEAESKDGNMDVSQVESMIEESSSALERTTSQENLELNCFKSTELKDSDVDCGEVRTVVDGYNSTGADKIRKMESASQEETMNAKPNIGGLDFDCEDDSDYFGSSSAGSWMGGDEQSTNIMAREYNAVKSVPFKESFFESDTESESGFEVKSDGYGVSTNLGEDCGKELSYALGDFSDYVSEYEDDDEDFASHVYVSFSIPVFISDISCSFGSIKLGYVNLDVVGKCGEVCRPGLLRTGFCFYKYSKPRMTIVANISREELATYLPCKEELNAWKVEDYLCPSCVHEKKYYPLSRLDIDEANKEEEIEDLRIFDGEHDLFVCFKLDGKLYPACFETDSRSSSISIEVGPNKYDLVPKSSTNYTQEEWKAMKRRGVENILAVNLQFCFWSRTVFFDYNKCKQITVIINEQKHIIKFAHVDIIQKRTSLKPVPGSYVFQTAVQRGKYGSFGCDSLGAAISCRADAYKSKNGDKNTWIPGEKLLAETPRKLLSELPIGTPGRLYIDTGINLTYHNPALLRTFLTKSGKVILLEKFMNVVNCPTG